MKLPSWWLKKATPCSMACQRRPNMSATAPATSGATPSHKKPIRPANNKVLAGVGAAMK